MTDSNPNRIEQETNAAIETLPQHLRERAALLSFPVLHDACMQGDLELVTALIDAGLGPIQYPETDDEDDQPPLTWLAGFRVNAAKNAVEVAKLLIERSDSVDEGDPLRVAIQASDLSMARLLLAAGADVERASEDLLTNEEALLEMLQHPYWSAPLAAEPTYFIAFDSDQEIFGVGLSAEDAVSHAQLDDAEGNYEALEATERLVAAFLGGEEVSWLIRDDLADLEEP